MERIRRVTAWGLAMVLALGAGVAWTQVYPARPVKLIVTYPPGGSSDLMARVFGQRLSEIWGQQVVVESRPGAAGAIGMEYAARQAADGYAFVVGNLGPTAVNPLLSKVPYDVARDFVAVSLIATGPNILVVNPSRSSVRTVAEMLAQARDNPGRLSFGTSGPGSVAHLAGEMFQSLGKVRLLHVPYKGGILSVQDLVGGQVDMVFSDALPVMQFIRSGKLRPIAITSARRSVLVPDIPTFAESGLPALIADNWWGVLLPAGTSRAIVEKFHRDIVRTMQHPEVKEKFAGLGVDAVHSTPEEFTTFIRAETDKFARLIKDVGIRTD